MKPFPAIAFFETTAVTDGVPLADTMLKTAPVSLLRSGIVSGGKFLILLAGTVGAVETAWQTARQLPDRVSNMLFLPDVHPDVYAAICGQQQSAAAEALTVFQSNSIANTIQISDQIVKACEVRLLQLHLGDGYSGRGFAIFNGALYDAEIAAEIAGRSSQENTVSLIPQISDALLQQLATSLQFSRAEDIYPEGGESPDASR